MTSWAFLEPKSQHWLKAEVPGCVHTDLLRHKRIPDPFWGSHEKELQWIEERDWEYRCRFVVEPRFCEYEHVELVAEGLDTIATIRLNGHLLGSTENMFLEYRFDAKKAIRTGRNVLEIHFASPAEYIRRSQKTGRFRGVERPCRRPVPASQSSIFLWLGLGTPLRLMRRVQADPSRGVGRKPL